MALYPPSLGFFRAQYRVRVFGCASGWFLGRLFAFLYVDFLAVCRCDFRYGEFGRISVVLKKPEKGCEVQGCASNQGTRMKIIL